MGLEPGVGEVASELEVGAVGKRWQVGGPWVGRGAGEECECVCREVTSARPPRVAGQLDEAAEARGSVCTHQLSATASPRPDFPARPPPSGSPAPSPPSRHSLGCCRVLGPRHVRLGTPPPLLTSPCTEPDESVLVSPIQQKGGLAHRWRGAGRWEGAGGANTGLVPFWTSVSSFVKWQLL